MNKTNISAEPMLPLPRARRGVLDAHLGDCHLRHVDDLKVVAHHVLSEVFTALQNREHRNMLPLFTHVLEANLPNHIHVFLTAGHSLNAEQLEAIKLLAVTPTGNQTNFHTVESLNKEAAWNIILRLGLDKSASVVARSYERRIQLHICEIGGDSCVPAG